MAYRSSSNRQSVVVDDLPIADVPSGVAINDIIVLFGSQDSATSTWPTLPSGFTNFTGSPTSQATPDGQTTCCCWKRATAADTGTYAWGNIGATGAWIAQAYVFSGRHTTNPPVASTVVVNGTANPSVVNVTANGVTALDGDDLLWLGAPDVNAITIGNGMAPPATYTERQDFENTTPAGQEWQNMSGATKDNVSAGATGSITGQFTLTSGGAGYVAWLIRIPSAPAGGTVHFLSALGAGA